jgi:hypothetical protein
MQKLIATLTRLYLPDSGLSPKLLEQHLTGTAPVALRLSTDDGRTRAIVIAFDKAPGHEDDSHWRTLCTVANALQAELYLPAPAVSISGAHGYRLWLSLAEPVSTALAQQFIEQLHAAYFPDMNLVPDTANAAVAFPPCLHPGTGLWAAFINPGLGASFADESGLEMSPPIAGQLVLLDGLHSISAAQLAHAMTVLGQAQQTELPAAPLPKAAAPSLTPGLLLKDATLEQIVQHLHALHIEPTFRHLIRTV